MIEGSLPGVILIEATLSLNLVSSFTFFVFLTLNVFKISSLSLEILAMGSTFIGLNVSRFDVCIFRAAFAWIAMQVLSSVVSWPMSAISAMSEVAYFVEQIRFRAASVEPLSMDLWEYVRAMGLFGLPMKKERAAAV